jgi:hypothetical protein
MHLDIETGVIDVFLSSSQHLDEYLGLSELAAMS